MEIEKIKMFISNLKKQGISTDILEKNLKNYLHVLILEKIFRNDSFDFIFIGGTCLALCFDDDFPRLSEDLDFISRHNTLASTLKIFLEKTLYEENLGFAFEIIEKSKKSNTQRIEIKFPDILKKLGFVNNIADINVLKVKIEYTLDSNIQKLTNKEMLEITTPSIISKNNRSIVVKRLKDEGLMASKMIACKYRSFEVGKTGVRIKGRDFYDLIWYMERGIKPSIFMLGIYNITTKDIFSSLDSKILEIKNNDLKVDIENLFADKKYIESFIKDFKVKYQLLRQNYSIINIDYIQISDITKSVNDSYRTYSFTFYDYQNQNNKYFKIKTQILEREFIRLTILINHFKEKKEVINEFMNLSKYVSTDIEDIDKILITIIYDKIQNLIKTKGKDNILQNTVYSTDFLDIQSLDIFLNNYSFKFLEPTS
ncbi:nucleotidyl transferase AbiEii/AbiGii toxin family protein [Patescibacteria group bacterium]|nr:nucleotidyl transferase AbiEii/AbiGii toxin family protein [Patescibacteria group bacterium]